MATRYSHVNIIAEDWKSLCTFYTDSDFNPHQQAGEENARLF